MQDKVKNEDKRLVNLTFDAAFKLYFQRKPSLLKSLLKEFLPFPKTSTIKKVEILETNSPDGKFILEMKLHVSKRKEQSTKVEIMHVQMRITDKKDLCNRIEVDTIRYFARQLESESERGGNEPITATWGLAFATDEVEALAVKELLNEYYHCFGIKCTTPPYPLLTDAMQFAIVELPKFKKELTEVFDLRDAWCYLLKRSAEMDKNDCIELSKKGDYMEEAVKELWSLSQNEQEKEYLKLEKQRRDKEVDTSY